MSTFDSINRRLGFGRKGEERISLDVVVMNKVLAMADGQYGFFSADQAVAAGMRAESLGALERAQAIEEVVDRVYRVRAGGRHPYPRMYGLWLGLEDVPGWQRSISSPVVSHRSALRLHGIIDLPGPDLECTGTAVAERVLDGGLVMTPGTVDAEDCQRVLGMLVTTPLRTVRDVLWSMVVDPQQVDLMLHSLFERQLATETEIQQLVNELVNRQRH
jgi:hypothetical protein